jgi:hypothetical protein
MNPNLDAGGGGKTNVSNYEMNGNSFRNTMHSLNYGNVMEAAARNYMKEVKADEAAGANVGPVQYDLEDLGAFYTLVPIRTRWRGERRSLRTFLGASLRPPLAFIPRHRRLSTPTDAFELHPDVRSYGMALRGRPGAARAPQGTHTADEGRAREAEGYGEQRARDVRGRERGRISSRGYGRVSGAFTFATGRHTTASAW